MRPPKKAPAATRPRRARASVRAMVSVRQFVGPTCDTRALARKFRAASQTPGVCSRFDTRQAFGSCQRIANLLLVLVDDLVVRVNDLLLTSRRAAGRLA